MSLRAALCLVAVLDARGDPVGAAHTDSAAVLGQLSLSPGTLQPAFSPSVAAYTADEQVGASVALQLSASSPAATVTLYRGPAPPPPPPSPPGRPQHYANPYSGPCTGGDKFVTLQGIPGEFCSPHCNGAGSTCPAVPAGGSGVVGECVVETAGITDGCAMSCTTAGAHCPGASQCVTTGASGAAAKICTYHSGPSPPPSPPGPTPPPPPPPGKTLGGRWYYIEAAGGQRDEYLITVTGPGAFNVAVVSGGHGWATATGSMNGDSLTVHFDNGVQDEGTVNGQFTSIDWNDGTQWVKESSPSPSPPSPPTHHDITGDWRYVDSGGSSHTYAVDQSPDGSFTATGDGQPWHSANGVVESSGDVTIKYDTTGSMHGSLENADDTIAWQDGTAWDKTSADAESADEGVSIGYHNHRQLLLTRTTIAAVSPLLTGAATRLTVVGCSISSKGSTSHCAGTGKLNATIELGNQTNESVLLTIVVEDPASTGNSSTRSVTTLTLVSTAPSPGGGAAACYSALGSVCEPSRRQGLFQCAACAGSHPQPLHQAGCNQSQIQAWCSNATCVPVLQQLCGAAKAAGTFQCASCIGAHQQDLNASCTAAQEQAWCTGGGPAPPPTPPGPPAPPTPGQCVPCGSATTCCTPGLSPPQLCPGGAQCCACKAASCACN